MTDEVQPKGRVLALDSQDREREERRRKLKGRGDKRKERRKEFSPSRRPFRI